MRLLPLTMMCLIVLSSCEGAHQFSAERISVNGRDYLIPKCKPSVSGDVVVRTSGTPVKIREISADERQLRQARRVIEVVDNHRLAVCDPLRSFTYDEKAFSRALDQIQQDQTIINQFPIAVQDPEALRDFVSRYGPRAAQITIKTHKATGASSVTPLTLSNAIKRDRQTASLAEPKHYDYKVSKAAPKEKLFTQATIEKARSAGVLATQGAEPKLGLIRPPPSMPEENESPGTSPTPHP